ncbi:MAG: hypothetical protein ABH834_08095, partial [Candidatus Altiarchaeota archaeon]
MKDKKPYVPPRTMEMPAPPKVAQQVTPEQVRREAQREALKVMPGEIGIAQNLILQKGESAREEFTQADARKERVFDCVKSAVDCIQDSPDLAKAKTKFFQGQKGQLGTGEVEAAEQIFDQVYVNMQEMQYEGSAARPAPIATQTEAAGKQSADTTPQPHLNPEKAPAALDVARIDSRWVQFPGQVDPTNPKTPVVYLDTGESEIVDLSRYEGRRFHFGRGADGPGVSPFDESSAGSPNKPRVGHMDGQITEAEVAAIHFGEQDGAYPELKREVDVWGEFTRKRDNVQGGGPAPAAGKTSAADLADDLVAAPLYSTSIPSDKQLRDAGLSDESIEKLKERVQAIREDPQAMALARNALLSENTFERNEARLMYMTYLGIKPA